MSEIETWRGKIKEITSNDLELDEHLELLINHYAPDYKWFSDNIEENFRECFCQEDRFILIGKRIFVVLKQEDLQYQDIYEASKNKDNTINFLIQYSNGGMGHSEAIEKALENMENNND